MGRPPTRPNPLDDGIVEKICDRLVAGESITSICSDETMPATTMVYQAMAKDEAFRNAIACAREAQQEAIIDQTIDIADSATPEDYNVMKLRIWARQWRASKLAPKKYGDKIITENTNINIGPSLRDMSDDHLLELAQRLLPASDDNQSS